MQYLTLLTVNNGITVFPMCQQTKNRIVKNAVSGMGEIISLYRYFFRLANANFMVNPYLSYLINLILYHLKHNIEQNKAKIKTTEKISQKYGIKVEPK